MEWERLLFPRRCVHCNKSWGSYVCEQCFRSVEYCNTQYCPVCEKPAIGGITHPRCLKRTSIDGHVSVTRYDGVSKSILEFFKRRGVYRLLPHIQAIWEAYLCDEDDPFPFFPERPVVLPVPLFWIDERTRPYSVAGELACIAGEVLSFSVEKKILVKFKPTFPQKDLDREHRLTNVKDSFSVSSHGTLEKAYLLVDDVWTTGATMRECARVLKLQGAEQVWGITFCRGV